MVHPELWLRSCMARITPVLAEGRAVVITDVRFENEAELIRGRGGWIVHITRPGLHAVEAHASEGGVRVAHGDLKLINSRTCAEWRRQAEHLGAFLLDPDTGEAVA